MALGEWLQKMGAEVDKTPVGIAVQRGSGLALATKAQGWLLDYADSPPAAFSGVLRKALLTERTAPALVTGDTGDLVVALEEWMGEYDRNALLPNIVHDMKTLEYATGRLVARDLTPLKDALDCAVVGPGMALEAPRFYHQVGMPLVRFNSRSVQLTDGRLVGPALEGEQHRWTLVYDWLLFKVLTHYTRDPTFTRWFVEDRSPVQEFSSYLEVNAKESIAFLLWMVCGEDEALVSHHYPDWAAHMPEAPQLIKASRVDKTMPALRLGLIRLIEQYTTTRRAETHYGRRSPWGLTPQELLHFVIMGSVNDLIDVLLASLIRDGSENHWVVPEAQTRYNLWLRTQVVGYTEEESQEWQRRLEQLGQLTHPLGAIHLDPKVSVE